MDRKYSKKIPNCSNEESKSSWQGLRDKDPQSSQAGWGTQTRAERQKARAHRERQKAKMVKCQQLGTPPRKYMGVYRTIHLTFLQASNF